MVNFDELERQIRLQGVDDRSGATVARIHHYLQRFQGAAIDIIEQVCDIFLSGVEGATAPCAARNDCGPSSWMVCKPLSPLIGFDSPEPASYRCNPWGCGL
jgi:hypothetical protein